MTKRRIFFWMGLALLFVVGLSQEGLTKETYKVKRGDTLATIASELGVSVKDLKQANGLKKTLVKPNQILSLPKQAKQPTRQEKKQTLAKSERTSPAQSDHYTVKKGDSLSRISKRTGISISMLQALNGSQVQALRPGSKLLLAKHEPAPEVIKRESKRPKVVPVVETGQEDFSLEDDPEDSEFINEDWTTVEKDKETSSELLGKWNSPNEKRIFVRVVKGFLGTPYRFGGTSVRGIDCSAFVAKVYQFFDVKLPRTAREQSRMGVKVSRDQLEEGDLIFFNTRRPFGHVGIYIGNNEFIHASSGVRSGKNVRIDNLDKPYYNKRFIKAVRVKGMKERKEDDRSLS